MVYIPYGRQSINADDIQAVTDVLTSDWLTQGPAVEQFEKQVAAYCGAEYAVAVNSATSALHIACLAAGLGQGDVLWTSPNTFVASANCGLYCGAIVDFVDIDARTYNLSTDELAKRLKAAKSQGRLPKVVIPVHFAGQPCAMKDISLLAKEYGFAVIEDASHALGATYNGEKVGACHLSDMTILSFHPVKIMTTGEGGMVLTNSRDLYEKLLLLRSHGITRDPRQMAGEAHGPWYYQQIDLGFNYRITDIQAALGVSQLKRLDDFIGRRRALAHRYNNMLKCLPLGLPYQAAGADSAWHLYVVQIKAGGNSRLEVFTDLRNAGIGVNVHYIPVHTQPYYSAQGFKNGDFPVAEAYYQTAISLPMYYALTDEEQDYVVDKLREALE